MSSMPLILVAPVIMPVLPSSPLLFTVATNGFFTKGAALIVAGAVAATSNAMAYVGLRPKIDLS